MTTSHPLHRADALKTWWERLRTLIRVSRRRYPFQLAELTELGYSLDRAILEQRERSAGRVARFDLYRTRQEVDDEIVLTVDRLGFQGDLGDDDGAA